MALKDSYLNLITSQHRGKPKFGATMAKLLQPSEDIFALGIFMDESFDLDLAAGKQQDILGDIVGLPRTMNFTMGPDRSSVLDDEEYRVLQKAKIVRNLWNGRIEDLYEKWMVLFGTPIKVKDNQDMTLDVLLDVDESSEMQKLMKLTARGLIVPKPMGVGVNYKFYYPTIRLPIEVTHTANIMGKVDTRHNIWTRGEAKVTRWDSEYNFDRTIRFDGIFGADYRDRQQHKAEAWIKVEAWQRNLVLVNVFDTSFEFDNTHTWRGASFARPPISKIAAGGVSGAHHPQPLQQTCGIYPRPDIYLSNSVEYKACDTQHIEAAYNTDYRDANCMDGSFCFDGSHAFEGLQKQNIAKITHLCTVQKTNKTNKIERMDRV